MMELVLSDKKEIYMDFAMRSLIGLSVFCAVVFIMPFSAKAQEKPESSTTEIITDQETGTITIFIEGKPVALFDKNGFHVLKDIEYGGTIADVGQETIEKLIENQEAGHAR